MWLVARGGSIVYASWVHKLKMNALCWSWKKRSTFSTRSGTCYCLLQQSCPALHQTICTVLQLGSSLCDGSVNTCLYWWRLVNTQSCIGEFNLPEHWQGWILTQDNVSVLVGCQSPLQSSAGVLRAKHFASLHSRQPHICLLLLGTISPCTWVPVQSVSWDTFMCRAQETITPSDD